LSRKSGSHLRPCPVHTTDFNPLLLCHTVCRNFVRLFCLALAVQRFGGGARFGGEMTGNASFAVRALMWLTWAAANAPAQDWLTWGGSPQRASWAERETAFTRENVGKTALKWRTQ